MIIPPFARAAACLLLAACLLAAKHGRSTLDTKKGYKTKTGSTSSVTLALALTVGSGQSESWGPKWSNDVAKAAMNEIGGILFSPINMVGMAKLAGCKS